MNPALDQLPPDLQFDILLQSDLETIREYCQTFPKLRTLCSDNRLWQQKFFELLKSEEVETSEDFSQTDNWMLLYRQFSDIINSSRAIIYLWVIKSPEKKIEIIMNVKSHRSAPVAKCMEHVKDYKIEPYYSIYKKYDFQDWNNSMLWEESILFNNFISPQPMPTLNSYTLFRGSQSSGFARAVFTLRTDKVEEMYQAIAFMYTHRETIKKMKMNMEGLHGRPINIIAEAFNRELDSVPELRKYIVPGYKFNTNDVKFIFDHVQAIPVTYSIVPGTFYNCIRVQPFESLSSAIYQPIKNFTFATIVDIPEGYRERYPRVALYRLSILANFVDESERDVIRCAEKFARNNLTNYENEFFDLHPNPGNTCLNLIKVDGKNVPEVLFTISGNDEKQMHEFIALLLNHRRQLSKIYDQMGSKLGDFIRTFWHELVINNRGSPLDIVFTENDINTFIYVLYYRQDFGYVIQKSKIVPCP